MELHNNSFGANSPHRCSPSNVRARGRGRGHGTPTTQDRRQGDGGVNSSWRSPGANSNSWGSSVLPGPRPGEALDFKRPARAKPRPEVVLAGLRQFVMERFGGIWECFERMDFHRNGRVSCLEFQEVISGQEKYCGLHEARDIFCMLARGTVGSLSFDDLRNRLGTAGSTYSALMKEHVECDRDSAAASWSCASSDGSSRLAGTALRALLFGRGDAHIADTETDAATTVGPLTARSSQSVPATFGRPPTPTTQAFLLTSQGMAPTPSSPSACSGHGLYNRDTFNAFGTEPFARAEAALVPLPKGGWGDALLNGSFNRNCMESDRHPSRISTAVGRSQSLSNLHSDTSLGLQDGSALSRLDEGLYTLRAEVAALNALRSSQSSPALDVSSTKQQVCASPGRLSHDQMRTSFEQLAAPPPGGLAWILRLPQNTQGRLAACTGVAEVIDVLDEALDGLPTSSGSTLDFASTPSRSGRWRSKSLASGLSPAGRSAGGVGSTVAVAQEPAVSSNLVAASAELLRTMRSRSAELEAELASRQRRHEEHLVELKQQLRDERHRKLQRLLGKLGHCPSTAHAEARELDGLNNAPLPPSLAGSPLAE